MKRNTFKFEQENNRHKGNGHLLSLERSVHPKTKEIPNIYKTTQYLKQHMDKFKNKSNIKLPTPASSQFISLQNTNSFDKDFPQASISKLLGKVSNRSVSNNPVDPRFVVGQNSVMTTNENKYNILSEQIQNYVKNSDLVSSSKIKQQTFDIHKHRKFRENLIDYDEYYVSKNEESVVKPESDEAILEKTLEETKETSVLMDYKKFKKNGSPKRKYKNRHHSSFSIDGESSIESFMTREQYQTSNLMKANEHITAEAFQSMIPKQSKFQANQEAEMLQTYEKDGRMHSSIHMDDKQDAARINKAFLKNIGVMLPRIIDPNHVQRFKTKPANTSLKYIINKHSRIQTTSMSTKSALQSKQQSRKNQDTRSAMNIRPNYYSNFKMGKFEGGYMLNYKQYYKNPLDHHFKNSGKPELIKKKNQSTASVPKYIEGIDPNFLLTDEESRQHTEHERSPSRLLAKRIENERLKLRKPELLCDKSKTINLIQE